jgi:hypothetical protein
MNSRLTFFSLGPMMGIVAIPIGWSGSSQIACAILMALVALPTSPGGFKGPAPSDCGLDRIKAFTFRAAWLNAVVRRV